MNPTSTPWKAHFIAAHDNWEITDENNQINIAQVYGYDTDEARDSNAALIVSAVNNTYGIGIKPEAVYNMKSALLMAREELCFGGDWKNAIKIIDSAIQKSKL